MNKNEVYLYLENTSNNSHLIRVYDRKNGKLISEITSKMISKTLLAFLSSWIIENTEFEKNLRIQSFLNFQKRRCQIKLAFHQKIVELKHITLKIMVFTT